MAAIIASCDRTGLAVVITGAARGAASIALTEAGHRAREAGREARTATESDWLARFQSARNLRDDLGSLVEQLDLELPHFPIGYGPVDDSMTGGSSRPGKDGPPRVPPHGQDWIPVVRTDVVNVDDLSLIALLSQVLVAFAIDFEERGSSLPTTVIWQQIPDDGVIASALPDGCPNPSGWERHGLATIDPSPLKKRSLVTLTARAKAFRDAYVPRTTDVEDAWRLRFGHDLVVRLREGLEALVDEADLSHCPQFPRVSWIAGLREVS
jgi:hypothetical protein